MILWRWIMRVLLAPTKHKSSNLLAYTCTTRHHSWRWWWREVWVQRCCWCDGHLMFTDQHVSQRAFIHSDILHSLQCEHRYRLLLSSTRSIDKLTSDDNFLYCLNIHCWERVSLTTHTRWNIHPIYISWRESWRHRLVCSRYTQPGQAGRQPTDASSRFANCFRTQLCVLCLRWYHRLLARISQCYVIQPETRCFVTVTAALNVRT